ncbi:MAG: AMP-binding protein [Planctomycetes bacterium]|nr:AMP-binding protein [Planctomycetota bacterium]
MAEASFRSRSNRFLVELDRERTVAELDYRAFRAEAARCAEALRARGLEAGQRLALLLSNGPQWLIAAYAGIQLGAVLVPLDARLDPAGQASLLAHCGALHLVTDGPVWRRLEAALEAPLRAALVVRPLSDLQQPAEDWDQALPVAPPPLEADSSRSRDDLAAIVYSSGTSGRPKGCLLSHGNYLSQLEALANAFPLEEDDVYLSILPSNHAIDFMCGFLVPLLCGARIVHLRTLRPEWIVDALKTQRVTHLAAVPALLSAIERNLKDRLSGLERLPAAGLRGLRRLNELLTERQPRPWLSRTLLQPIHQALGGRLRTIFAGGAPVPVETARFLYGLGIPVAIGYGQTEAGTVITVNRLTPFRAETVGPPLEGVEVKIHEPDAEGRGEVWVRGPNVFQGYLDDPELSAEAFAGGGWLKTGDLGAFDSTGHLCLVGRKKHMIVTPGGKNVYPEELEAKLTGLDVEELAVLPSHSIWPSAPGEHEGLVLVARPRDSKGWFEEVVRRNRRLPAYLRLAGVLIRETPFPKTTSLKLKRHELAEELATRPRADLRRLS